MWWRVPRLRAGIRRLGIVDEAAAYELAVHLEHERRVDTGDWLVAKLLVSNAPFQGQSWLNLTLEEADNFITRRIKSYKNEKEADRLRFPDDLMQYFAWKVQL